MEEHPNPRKGGRPPNPNKLDKTIRVRITSDDYHRCKKIAEETNMNVTEYFRKMMTEGKVIKISFHYLIAFLKAMILHKGIYVNALLLLKCRNTIMESCVYQRFQFNDLNMVSKTLEEFKNFYNFEQIH